MGEYCRTAVFEPAGAGGFVVTCAAFPGLVTAGGTMEEARTMLTLKAGGKSSPLLPSLKNEDVLRVPGWFVHHVKHPDKPRPRVTQPRHSTDLKRRTRRSLLALAGCKVDEFVELL